jgi:tetratricopeptide (TPR) repeat protein
MHSLYRSNPACNRGQAAAAAPAVALAMVLAVAVALAGALAMREPAPLAVVEAQSLAQPFLTTQAAVVPPFEPRAGAEVLETRPRRGAAPQAALRRLRAQLAAAPRDQALASTLAQRYIELGRAQGDPRYFGYAQAALAPWWNDAAPPLPALLLRATLLQSNHRFDEAIRDLETVLRMDPANAQAWLTLATVQVVRGQHGAAVRSCGRLSSLAGQLVSITCLANARAANGQLAASERLLVLAVARSDAAPGAEAVGGAGGRSGGARGGASDEASGELGGAGAGAWGGTMRVTDAGMAGVRLWASTLLGELAARRGDHAQAEARFRQALAIAPGDSYLLGAYADLMLDQGRHAEVQALLREHVRNDGLLLRHTLAASLAARAPPATVASAIDELQARFDAAQRRGESIHGREQARFELHLRHDPHTALRIAQANWQAQKEAADLRVLLEAALAAREPAAARDALAWRRQHQFEDAKIAALARELEGG